MSDEHPQQEHHTITVYDGDFQRRHVPWEKWKDGSSWGGLPEVQRVL